MQDFDSFLNFIRELRDRGYCSAKVEKMSESQLALKIAIDLGDLPAGVTVESVQKVLGML
mgnify:CR=1 FL=1